MDFLILLIDIQGLRVSVEDNRRKCRNTAVERRITAVSARFRCSIAYSRNMTIASTAISTNLLCSGTGTSYFMKYIAVTSDNS